jgi:hypothetical protein
VAVSLRRSRRAVSLIASCHLSSRRKPGSITAAVRGYAKLESQPFLERDEVRLNRSGGRLAAPLPLAGEVISHRKMRYGWGLSPHNRCDSRRHPHPSPPPQAGEGARFLRGCSNLITLWQSTTVVMGPCSKAGATPCLFCRFKFQTARDVRPHSRGRICPSFALTPAPDQKRAQGKPDARCTRGLVCRNAQRNAHEHTGSAEALRLSLRDGLRLTSRSPR